MEMRGEYRIAAPRQEVWRALNDPDVLRRSIPGREEIRGAHECQAECSHGSPRGGALG